MPMAYFTPSICATATPGTRRKTSGMFLAPDARIISCVTT